MSKQRVFVLKDDDVLLCGYYKKLKTMKKKFFILYNETSCNGARLEYYDNEKKFKSGLTPKRIIKINNCFHIKRRLYTKHEFVIVLASKEDGFGIVMESEEEMNTWLNHLLQLQRTGEQYFDFPSFDNVWQVIIQKKGIAEQHSLSGSYHICLTNKSVTFIKIGRDKNVRNKKISKADVLLTTIRRCGDSQCYFYMEIGRQSTLGPGELWMETEDALTAQDMHRMILSKMILLNEAALEPMRKRSSSATETTNLNHDVKCSQNEDITKNYLLNAPTFNRERCDSLPSRNRNSSECSNHSIRMMPTTLGSRVMNFHIRNSSPLTNSASEESVSVDDSDERLEMPSLLRSRSPEGAIPEEHVDDSSHAQNSNKKSDANCLSSAIKPGNKFIVNRLKQGCVSKMIDTNKDICGNVDDQLPITVRTYSFGGKGEHNLTKEALVDRVRAFSVGSRIKNPSVCPKTGRRLLNSDNIKINFEENSARKSISVPAFINKNVRSVDQMGDLMEIDFSKSGDKIGKWAEKQNKNVCYKTLDLLPLLNTLAAKESVHMETPIIDNGYLEMRPIKQISNKVPRNSSSQQTHITTLNETNNDTISPSSHEVTQFHNMSINEDSKVAQRTINTPSKNCVDKNSSDDIKICNAGVPLINQDLYYASLDLPKSGSEVNTRYDFKKEGLSDTNVAEMKNDYVKIHFDQPETSCSLKE